QCGLSNAADAACAAFRLVRARARALRLGFRVGREYSSVLSCQRVFLDRCRVGLLLVRIAIECIPFSRGLWAVGREAKRCNLVERLLASTIGLGLRHVVRTDAGNGGFTAGGGRGTGG